jgi:CheY-like chemotaxis protein
MRAKGGLLTLALHEQTYSSPTTVGDTELAGGEYVRLTITDNGQGIEPEILKRIFDPFFTTKSREEGTGMGLSVVHGIVKNHGGAIGVRSHPGQGTTFDVFFPKLKTMRKETLTNPAPLPGGSERILFVDDETSIVDTLSKRLTRQGYQVVSRTSSRAALAEFKLDPAGYDLVITDRTMPEMTGLELAQEILQIRPEIPVILCTGFSDQLDEEKVKAMGFAEFLLKPVLTRDLLEGIRRALERDNA